MTKYNEQDLKKFHEILKSFDPEEIKILYYLSEYPEGIDENTLISLIEKF